jgi:mannose-6-phosphate isomerase-like protein (cupin superfamily)
MKVMFQRVVVLGLVAGAVAFGAVAAFATPPAGIAGGPIVARGTAAENIVLGTPKMVTVTKAVKIRIRGKTYTRRVKVQVESVERLMACGAQACDTAFQQVTINPSGHTGWHNHPGPTFVAVVQGEGTLYHSAGTGCVGHKYVPNTGFFQPSADVHNLRNEGAEPLVIYAFYALPPGTPNTAIRADQPAPANCSNIP